MANEISVTMALVHRKGGTMGGMDLGTFQVSMTGGSHLHHRQVVATSEEALNLGDAGAGGWCLLKNHGPTNYVVVKAASGADPLIRIPAGEAALFRLDSDAVAPFIQADTDVCEVECYIIEA